MLFAADIGNTETVIGLFDGMSLKRHWRVSSSREKTADEYGALFLSLLSSAGVDPAGLTGAIISSVVPVINRPFREAVKEYLAVPPLAVGEEVRPAMRLLVDNPAEVGADRVVNAVAAYSIYKTSLIVVDFGTAITFDYVTGDGEYAGGVIAPGIAVSAEALFLKTAMLPRVDISRPERVIGRNTAGCIRSGIYWGFAGLVDAIIVKMKAEMKTAPKVIATGGLCRVISSESSEITGVDEFLTLKGLRILYEGHR
ncbi:MAG: type III pantothenate kinase [Deltaproteobacteria bacterium]|nr:type III pantothenate kinase [Deltaproteobacteria bacterium]